MRRLCMILVLAALTALLLTGAALAAEGVATENYTTAGTDSTVTCVVENQKAKNYTAEYAGNDLVIGGNYALLVVKCRSGQTPVISADTIVYMDQVDNITEKKVSFKNFIPMSNPDCVVLLGGEFTGGTSPKTLGTIIGQGVNVTGKVKSYNPQNPVTVQLLQGASVAAETIIAKAAGSGQVTQNFTLESVPAGTYDLVVKKDGHLTYKVTNVVVGDADLDLAAATEKAYATITLLSADITNDGTINNSDLTQLSINFMKMGANIQNAKADITGDGSVNNSDLTPLSMNFMKTNALCVVGY